MNPTFFAFLLSGIFFTLAVADVSVEEAIASNSFVVSPPVPASNDGGFPPEWELLHRQRVDG